MPREAELTDPQQRLFLESVWQALEDAGCDPERFPGRIGVFAGAGQNLYGERLASRPELVGSVGYFQLALGNRADFLPTRVSYKLNLRGPSVNVRTACSTSLVAVVADRGFCAIGSLKTNVGHLDTAAGVAGLIKTVLALDHRRIPPSLHFTAPNPRLELEASPFYVNTRLADWETDGGPRRAGVSSFGIGGTNAHVVLEEAPPSAPSAEGRPWQLHVSMNLRPQVDEMGGKLRVWLDRVEGA